MCLVQAGQCAHLGVGAFEEGLVCLDVRAYRARDSISRRANAHLRDGGFFRQIAEEIFPAFVHFRTSIKHGE